MKSTKEIVNFAKLWISEAHPKVQGALKYKREQQETQQQQQAPQKAAEKGNHEEDSDDTEEEEEEPQPQSGSNVPGL